MDLPPRNGKLKNPDLFDNDFFNIAEYEAAVMDPQERILLELTYEALLDAGVNPKELRGSNTGFYWGSCFVEVHEDAVDPQKAHFAQTCVTRVSNAFGFKGPVLLVDTGMQ